jgi:hypothetical protein
MEEKREEFEKERERRRTSQRSRWPIGGIFALPRSDRAQREPKNGILFVPINLDRVAFAGMQIAGEERRTKNVTMPREEHHSRVEEMRSAPRPDAMLALVGSRSQEKSIIFLC